MVLQKGLELLQGFLALDRRDEQHGLAASLHVNEDGDVVMASLAGRFVQTNGLHIRKIKIGHGLAHVMLNDSPQPLVGDPADAGSRIDWHLSCQRQGCLLEKQGEGVALACPGHLGQLHPMFRTLHPGYRGMHIAVVLEEVQMAPCLLLEVMRGAFPAADRAGVLGTPFRLDFQVQFMWLLVGVQVLIDQLPRAPLCPAQEARPVGCPSPIPPCRFAAYSGTGCGLNSTRNDEEPAKNTKSSKCSATW